MAWIESHQELGRHPKTRKLARALGISLPATVGHLHYLWWWALDFAQNGDISRYDAEELAEAALWEGDPAAFVEALTLAGFVDRATSRLHDWDQYVGKLLDRRRANAWRQADWRNRQKTQESSASDATRASDETARNSNITVTSPLRNGATVPNRTVPNLNVKRLRVAPHDVSDAKSAGVGEGGRAPSKDDEQRPPERPPVYMRDPLYPELCRVLKQQPRTRPQHGEWAQAIRDMRDAGIAPRDLAHGVAQYRAQWPNNAVTPSALVKLWTAIGGRYSAAPDVQPTPQEVSYGNPTTRLSETQPSPVDPRAYTAAQQERFAAKLAELDANRTNRDKPPDGGGA